MWVEYCTFICAFLVHMNQVTHFGTVSYLFACLKWQMICVWWELFECKLTPLHFVGLDNKRSETTLEWSLPLRTSCTTAAAAVCSSLLLIWSIQRLKAYLVSPSLFNCNHFHLSSVTKPKSRLSSCIKTSDKFPLSTHNLWPKAAEGAGLRLRSWSFAVV